MSDYRIYVEKYPEFQVEAKSLLSELNENLQLKLRTLRLLNVYDLFGFTPELLEKSRYSVFGEVVTDSVTDVIDLDGAKYIAVEYLPGQFDQRAASAVDCVHLIDPSAKISIKSSKLIIIDDDASEETLEKIRHYYINPVESRPKDLSKLSDTEHADVKPVPMLDGFRNMQGDELKAYCRKMGLAMSPEDLAEVVKYFTEEGRDPNETELRILDTYWSDHCRHTTFTTELEDIKVEESFIKEDIDGTLNLYLRMRKELGREAKGLNLMDIATIGARYLRKAGKLDDMEVSEENNACSIFIDVEVEKDPAGDSERSDAGSLRGTPLNPPGGCRGVDGCGGACTLVLASDAFFPFDDCVTLAAEYGVKAIVQPGGSIRDEDSIKKCNELGIAMLFTGERHFKH